MDLVPNPAPASTLPWNSPEMNCGPLSDLMVMGRPWRLKISSRPHDFRVVDAPGQSNVVAPLSRLLSPNKITVHQHGAEEYLQFAAISATPAAIITGKVEEASAVDEELKVMKEAIKTS